MTDERKDLKSSGFCAGSEEPQDRRYTVKPNEGRDEQAAAFHKWLHAIPEAQLKDLVMDAWWKGMLKEHDIHKHFIREFEKGIKTLPEIKIPTNQQINETINFLRTGKGGRKPFLYPEEILAADPKFEVNWYFNQPEHPIDEVDVFDTSLGIHFICPLNAKCEILWRKWEAIP